MSWNGEGQRHFILEEEDAPKGCLVSTGGAITPVSTESPTHFPLPLSGFGARLPYFGQGFDSLACAGDGGAKAVPLSCCHPQTLLWCNP